MRNRAACAGVLVFVFLACLCHSHEALDSLSRRNQGSAVASKLQAHVRMHARARASDALRTLPGSSATDVAALNDLFYATSGYLWRNSSRWPLLNDGQHCRAYGIRCDQDLRVTELSLGSNNLVGFLPSSIGHLNALEILNLQSNGIRGPIPDSFGGMTSLVSLDLSFNKLSGGIPASIGNLSSLIYLSFLTNSLSGQVPASFSKLVQLSYVDLSFNQLVGDNIDYFVCPIILLQYLYLSSNEFSTSIPDCLPLLSSLVVLDLSSNLLDRTIPPSICNAVSLQYLYLEGNSMSGPIPDCVGNLRSLVTLSLSSNSFSGPLPSSIGSMRVLEDLSLTSNSFSGPLPQTLYSLQSLRILYLSDNSFEGTLDKNIGNLTSLTDINVAMNLFTGTFPVEISKLVNLHTITAFSNLFGGALGVDFSNLTLLRRFDVSLNKFTSIELSSLSHIQSLVVLNLALNSFSGNLDDSLFRNWDNMNIVDLSYNNFSGRIPSSFCACTGIVVANFAGNYFSSISACPQPMSSLRILSLASNNLSFFPWRNLSSSFPFLLTLDLSFNRINGTFDDIQDFLRKHETVQSLDVSDNLLVGSFPLNPCNVLSRTLNVIDLGGNTITDMGKLLVQNSDHDSIVICDTTNSFLYSLEMDDCGLRTEYVDSINFNESPYVTSQTVQSLLKTWFPGLEVVDLSSNPLLTGPIFDFKTLSVLSVLNLQNTSMIAELDRIDEFISFSSVSIQHGSYSCLQAIAKKNTVNVEIPPEYFSYRNCFCVSGYYGKPPFCQPCMPDQAECPGFLSVDSSSIADYGISVWNYSGWISAKRGWWITPPCDEVSQLLGSCAAVDFLRCSHFGTDLTPCAGSAENNFFRVCAVGYEERLCSKCSDSYFNFHGLCFQCPTGGYLVAFGIVIVFIFVVLIAICLVIGSDSSGLFKVLVFFLQMLYAIDVPLPRSLALVSSSASSPFTIPGPECFFDNWTLISEFIASLVLPFLASLCVLLVYVVGNVFFAPLLRRSNSHIMWNHRCIRAVVAIFFIMYFPTSETAISSLMCDHDPGLHQDYFSQRPYEQCNNTFRYICATVVVVYVLLAPVFLALYVKARVLAGDAPSALARRKIFNILFSSYRDGSRYWELVITLRRVLLLFAFLLIPTTSVFSPLMISSIFAASLVFQVLFMPFRLQIDNGAEVIGLSILLVNLCVSQSFRAASVSNGEDVGVALFCVNLLFVLSVFGILVYQLTYAIMHPNRTSSAKMSMSMSYTLNQPLIVGSDKSSSDADVDCQNEIEMVNQDARGSPRL
eukprot:ANDGO_07724.mRNA.1 LRR receptor-like serine/threonine-protein kinase GSO1